MNLNTACKPRQSVFDRSRKDVVLNIDNLQTVNGLFTTHNHHRFS